MVFSRHRKVVIAITIITTIILQTHALGLPFPCAFVFIASHTILCCEALACIESLYRSNLIRMCVIVMCVRRPWRRRRRRPIAKQVLTFNVFCSGRLFNVHPRNRNNACVFWASFGTSSIGTWEQWTQRWRHEAKPFNNKCISRVRANESENWLDTFSHAPRAPEDR